MAQEVATAADAEFGRCPPRVVASPPGPNAVRWIEQLARTECPSLTTRRARRAEKAGAPSDPIVWEAARGANVRDVDGNVYVDLTAGFCVAALGHAHPAIVAAVQAQVATLPHALGDVHPSVPKLELMERLVALAPFDDGRVILGLNGADAIAAALKTAALHSKRPGVLAFEGGYHGLMYGPLALCGYSAGFRAPFAAQLNPHVSFAPYPRAPEELTTCLAAVDAALAEGDIGAIVVEPALGRGGCVFPPAGFFRGLRERCDAAGVCLVLDEIFTGFGRTGAAWGQDEASPDLLCVGKALGGGLPISACIGRADVMAAWGDPDGAAIHAATFAGNPLACAAALASLDAMQAERVTERARDSGARWAAALDEALRDKPAYRGVRGRGLMLALELDSGPRALGLVTALLERGYLALPSGAQGVQLTPPLTIDEALLEGATAAIEAAL